MKIFIVFFLFVIYFCIFSASCFSKNVPSVYLSTDNLLDIADNLEPWTTKEKQEKLVEKNLKKHHLNK